MRIENTNPKIENLLRANVGEKVRLVGRMGILFRTHGILSISEANGLWIVSLSPENTFSFETSSVKKIYTKDPTEDWSISIYV